MPNFTPSKTVTELVSGRTRDDSFDDAVRAAWAARTTDLPVLEELVESADVADEYRKGLARSAKFLAENESGMPVRVALQIEEVTEGKNKGKVWVRFSAAEKRVSPRRGSNGADADAAETKADADAGFLTDADTE